MKQPIRILEVLEATVGGTRKHLISILQEINRDDFHVEVASPKVRHGNVTDTAFYEEVHSLNIPWHSVEMSRAIHLGSDLKACIELARVIRHGNYDIIHLHSSKAGFLGRLAGKLYGLKIVYTPNGFYFLDSGNSLKRFFYTFLEQLAGRLTDRLIAVSNSERDIAIEHHILPVNKVLLIPNAIDTTLFVPDSDAGCRIRCELALSPSALVIGTVARYTPQKDPLGFVQAAALILEKFPGVRFVWCGEGELRTETENLAHALGVHNAFHFLGFRRDVNAIMNAFDLFVLSSIFEGLPYTLLEVMALGLPVVATNVVGNKDVIVDGETGILVPPQSPQDLMQAVSRLLDNPDLRHSMGQQGQRRVRDIYDVKTMVTTLEQVYRDLVAE